MSTGKVEFFKGIKNDSVVVHYDDEYLELFTDEQNIDPVIQALDMMINIPGDVNLDLADILHIPETYNAHSINYIHFRGEIDELNELGKLFKGEARSATKGILASIKSPPSAKIDGITRISDSIINGFGYRKDITIMWGAAPDESLTEFDVSIIEFY